MGIIKSFKDKLLNITKPKGDIYVNGINITEGRKSVTKVEILVDGQKVNGDFYSEDLLVILDSCESVSTSNGDVNIHEDVQGNVTTSNGNVEVRGNVYKSVKTTNGNVRAFSTDSITTTNGSITNVIG